MVTAPFLLLQALFYTTRLSKNRSLMEQKSLVKAIITSQNLVRNNKKSEQ